MASAGSRLRPSGLIGGLVRETAAAPIPGAYWYAAASPGAGILYKFAPGGLANAAYLRADMLLDGRQMVVFVLSLREGEGGPRFDLGFSALNQCSARIRIPLPNAVKLNRWRYEREGAWILPTCGGARVQLAKVDRVTLSVLRMGEPPARWCVTDIFISQDEPPRLEVPLIAKGPLIDELGQNRLGDWPGRTRGADEATSRLLDQAGRAVAHVRQAGHSRWGGSPARRFDAKGFFGVRHDGKRWWMVDPDGYVFWSAGINGVRPGVPAAISGIEKAAAWLPDPKGPFSAVYSERPGRPRTINFLAANFIRAFGPDLWYEKWVEITLGHLVEFGFNTMGWGSDWRAASGAKFPYVRSLRPDFPNTPKVYRDFPDVYDPWFREDLKAYAEPLRATAEDPAMIGYFLMNEPEWAFSNDPPGVGMLLNSTGGACRQMLATLLRQRYRTDERLSEKWGVKTTFAEITEGPWISPLNETARRDLTAFSAVMVTKLFDSLGEACRKADPNHLNLGARYFTLPPAWVIEAMRSFDVVSLNCYHDRPYPDAGDKVSAVLNKPVLIGEWHFGALDAGLPGGGMMRVRDQEARGRAFRVYIEDAAAKPWCIGAHWSDLYDQPALGRVDGACSNVGFLDVCNKPYEPLAKAARASMGRIYKIAQGELAPFNDAPEYLPRLAL